MQLHIGSFIREELRRQGHTNAWLADQIGITTRALQKIFNKQSIDTQLLSRICKALDADLFRLYSTWLGINSRSRDELTSNRIFTDKEEQPE